ncbi:MAG TPA: hypothetical protein VK465_08295 [Fibrobacteria bacterium]|nr:hypothetical protein [Fibrobacteria bacterium]
MNLVGGFFAVLYYALGLAGSLAWAHSLGASYVIGLVLWTSFFGFSMLVTCMLLWSREHWLG